MAYVDLRSIAKWGMVGVGLLLLAALIPSASAQEGHPGRENTPGVFDYYVLSLSWSPEHCVSSRNAKRDLQCSPRKHLGFVVHGLWPQYLSGYPEFCTDEQLSDDQAQNFLAALPTTRLIQHEWEKHGTCSGLRPQQYFNEAISFFGTVKLPDRYRHLSKPLVLSLDQFKASLLETNSNRDVSSIAVACDGRFLKEVEFCFEKNGNSRTCEADVRDSCAASTITIRAMP